MAIDFDPRRWDQIRETTDLWWERRLGRPIIQCVVRGARDPGRPDPGVGLSWFTALVPESVPPAAAIDQHDYNLSCDLYPGDAYPHFHPNFGPGALAPMLGGTAHLAREHPQTVWFGPPASGMRELAAYPDWTLDTGCAWYRRIESFVRAAAERWHGQVQIAMNDLGGNLDILSSFRPGEYLCLDLYDCPEEVKRRVWQAHESWFDAYRRLDAITRPANPGYTAWTTTFSSKPYYMLQCDFCYMVGPEQFEEFVLPELAASCRRLGNSFYHLDGVGQLPHLDLLLSIPELKGIQWVPGDGKPSQNHWPDLMRRIRDADKLIELWTDFRGFDEIVEQLGGDASCLCLVTSVDTGRRAETEAFLRKYGAWW